MHALNCWEQWAALNNGRGSKAVLGTGGWCTNRLKILCGLSLHILYPWRLRPKRCVCVTAWVLKHPAYLAKLTGRRIVYVLKCEIYYVRVAPPSVQFFRKNNSDSENCSATNRVLLLVSEAQEKIGSESTKRMGIACGLSLHILYLCRVRMKHIFVGAMLTVFKPQIISL